MTEQPAPLKFNPDAWSMGDMDDFEEITGLTLQEAFSPATVRDSGHETAVDKRGRPVKAIKMTAKTMIAIVLIEKRRDDPSFTLEQARQVKISEMVLDVAGEADPKDKPSENESTSS